jgi:hypothetical protein
LEAVGNLLLSLIGGGIAGAVVTYLFQTRGKIILQASRWEPLKSGKRPSGYRFHIVAYNTALMPDGISECRVVFGRDGSELFTSRPKRENWKAAQEWLFDGGPLPYRQPLEIIELPPRTPVHIEVWGMIEETDAEKALRSNQIEFVGYSPSKGKVRREVVISTSAPFSDDSFNA